MYHLKSMVLAQFALCIFACKGPPPKQLLSLEATKAAIRTIEIHDLNLPQELLVRRVERIRSFAEPHGIRITISDSIDKGMQVEWMKLHNGTLAALLKYTCGCTTLGYRVDRGIVEFCETSELTPEPSETDLPPP
jgi:hypothetical protein